MAFIQMLPPPDESRKTVTVGGRTYTGLSNMSILVQSFDVPVLEANGWMQLEQVPLSGGPGETWAARLRRLAASAYRNNPVDLAPDMLRGAIPWKPIAGTNTFSALTPGSYYAYGNQIYMACSAGTPVSPGPTSVSRTTTHISGNAYLVYLFGQVGDIVTNGGNLYELVTPGVPATSGGGPTGFGTVITDGTCTWRYAGKQTAPAVTYATAHDATLTNIITPGTIANYLIDGKMPIAITGGVPMAAPLNANGIVVKALTPSGAPGNIQISTGNGSAYATGVEYSICFDGSSKIEIAISGRYISGTTVLCLPKVVINDRYYIDMFLPIINSTSTVAYYTLDFTNVSNSVIPFHFGNRRVWKISIETSGAFPFLQIASASGTVFFPRRRDNFSAAVFMDSHGIGLGPNSQNGTPGTGVDHQVNTVWPKLFAKLAGLPNMVCLAQGSRGLANDLGTSSNYISNIDDLSVLDAYCPLKLIFVQGSRNDNGISDAALQSAAQTLFSSLRAQFPAVPVFYVPQVITDTNSVTHEQTILSVISNMQANGDDLTFCMQSYTSDGEWVPAGSPLIASDGLHGLPPLHAVYAEHVYKEYMRILNTIP